jgi:hypothetical protein
MLWQAPNNQVTTVICIDQYLRTCKILLRTPEITPATNVSDPEGNPAMAPFRHGYARRPPLLRGGVSLWLPSLANGNFRSFHIFGGETGLWKNKTKGGLIRAEHAFPLCRGSSMYVQKTFEPSTCDFGYTSRGLCRVCDVMRREAPSHQ